VAIAGEGQAGHLTDGVRQTRPGPAVAGGNAQAYRWGLVGRVWPSRRPALVPQRGYALGLREEPAVRFMPPSRAPSHKHLLLLLDNCEHLTAPCYCRHPPQQLRRCVSDHQPKGWGAGEPPFACVPRVPDGHPGIHPPTRALAALRRKLSWIARRHIAPTSPSRRPPGVAEIVLGWMVSPGIELGRRGWALREGIGHDWAIASVADLWAAHGAPASSLRADLD